MNRFVLTLLAALAAPAFAAAFQETSRPPKAGVKESYKPVHYTEIACAFKDFYYEGTVGEGGSVLPTGGGIGEFRCALGGSLDRAKPIELAAKEFREGFIETKSFGKIKVRFRSSLTGDDQYIIFMTDRQKAGLKNYLQQ